MKQKEIIEFIDDNISSALISGTQITDRYHHNSTYEDGPSIIKNGILTINDLNVRKIKKYSEQTLKNLDNIESHANGSDGVSLAVVGLTDLYKDEDEYDPFKPGSLDFIVDSAIIAGRSTYNYGNEFISRSSITPDKLKSVDIRLRKYLRLASKNGSNEELIKYYENLRLIALALKEQSLDIPLREMSDDNRCLDIDKVIKMPKCILK